MIAIILTGYSCSDKTTGATYLSRKYKLPYINLRRSFENLVGRENAASLYRELCIDSNRGKLHWLTILRPCIVQYQNSDFLLIEGLNSIDEINWIETNITDSLVVVYLKSEDRFQRFIKRYNWDRSAAYTRMSESDKWKNESQYDLERVSAYCINNSSDIISFYEQLDTMMNQLLHMPVLSSLCYVINQCSSYSLTPVELAYFIRQIGIAHGCRNACSHCFAESPYNVVQTELCGFSQLITEIGHAVRIKGIPLYFFHLGASTDPAMVKGYVSYLAEWIKAMPTFQTIKIFSHGWNLFSLDGKSELLDVVNYISSLNRDIRVVLSFDCFSISARLNWPTYIDNIINNIKLILRFVPKNKLRIEVFYPPERKEASPIALLDWWRNQAIRGIMLDWDLVLNLILTKCDTTAICTKTTVGLMHVFKECNLEFHDLIDMTRDCGMIFSSGRGTSFFKDKSSEDIEEGLNIQKQRVLYSLKNYEYGNNGLIIYPDGSVRFVDYEGYKLGKWVNGGKSIIKCMNIKKEL